MRHTSLLLVVAFLASGCARERINEGSESYSDDLSQLAQQEVIDNISETIDNPYRIPRRTTFGKGNLTFSDGSALSVAVPLHLFGKTAGTATGTAGTFTDSYQISLVPEVGGPTLQALRVVYQALVYPEDHRDTADALIRALKAGTLSISWKSTDGSPSTRPPTDDSFLVGRSKRYEIWATNREAFSRFVLLTYGDSPQDDRVKTSSSLLSAPATEPGGSGRKRVTHAPGRKSAPGRGDTFLPPNTPQLPPIDNKDKPQFVSPKVNLNQGAPDGFSTVLRALRTPKLPPGDNGSVVPTNPR